MKVKDFREITQGETFFYSEKTGKKISNKRIEKLQDCEVVTIWGNFRTVKDCLGFTLIVPFIACYVHIKENNKK